MVIVHANQYSFVLAVAIDVHCLVHWTEEDKVTVVRMCSVFDGTTVGDSCSVKLGSKVYSNAKILAIGT